MDRSSLGIKRIDRMQNTILRSMTNIVDVGTKTVNLKWDGAGYVSRMWNKK